MSLFHDVLTDALRPGHAPEPSASRPPNLSASASQLPMPGSPAQTDQLHPTPHPFGNRLSASATSLLGERAGILETPSTPRPRLEAPTPAARDLPGGPAPTLAHSDTTSGGPAPSKPAADPLRASTGVPDGERSDPGIGPDQRSGPTAVVAAGDASGSSSAASHATGSPSANEPVEAAVPAIAENPSDAHTDTRSERTAAIDRPPASMPDTPAAVPRRSAMVAPDGATPTTVPGVGDLARQAGPSQPLAAPSTPQALDAGATAALRNRENAGQAAAPAGPTNSSSAEHRASPASEPTPALPLPSNARATNRPPIGRDPEAEDRVFGREPADPAVVVEIGRLEVIVLEAPQPDLPSQAGPAQPTADLAARSYLRRF